MKVMRNGEYSCAQCNLDLGFQGLLHFHPQDSIQSIPYSSLNQKIKNIEEVEKMEEIVERLGGNVGKISNQSTLGENGKKINKNFVPFD